MINLSNIISYGRGTLPNLIEELHQQDYHGKRIYVLITDMFGNSLKTKMDIGVHNRLNIEQDECSFNAVIDNQRQEFKILVNSNEQIFAESYAL